MIEQADREALRLKYREERDKRLRPDGNDQYLHIADHFAGYLDDPYVDVEAREPRFSPLRLSWSSLP